jgi:hypothetical protein
MWIAVAHRAAVERGMPTFRSAWHWVFGKHAPRPPDPERTVEAAWVPFWQAQMIVDELVAEGIPAVMTEDFGVTVTVYSRETMARIFVTEDRKAEAEALIEEITGIPPAHRKF